MNYELFRLFVTTLILSVVSFLFGGAFGSRWPKLLSLILFLFTAVLFLVWVFNQ